MTCRSRSGVARPLFFFIFVGGTFFFPNLPAELSQTNFPKTHSKGQEHGQGEHDEEREAEHLSFGGDG